MTVSHQIATTRLIKSLNARGITLDIEDDRLLISPASRLTDMDRAEIRTHKLRLIRQLSPCGSHVNSAGWIREPVSGRPGWELAFCGRCGRSIGFNPIGGPDGRVQKLTGVTGN